MTKRREWPNSSREARDRAAEEAQRGIRALRPLVVHERTFTQTERLRRISIALDALQTIARHLESVGAQTRPD
jgi:hypothetical protein